jgi:alkylation response protein AidB-like acyl-CoA dehydrogenase
MRSRRLAESFPRLADHPALHGRRLKSLEDDVMRARDFSRNVIRPRALELDRRIGADTSDFAWDVARAGAREGLFSLIVPAASGGDANAFCLRASLVMEELSAGCAGVATIFGAHALGASPLLLAGMQFWDTLLREIAEGDKRGEPVIMAAAITEPTAGTDVEHHELVREARLGSRGRRVSGGYRISGTKVFISNGAVAKWIVVILPLDPQRPYETMSAFLVDSASDGFKVAHIEHKMGQRACTVAELQLDDVFVPDDRVVGRVGDGVMGTLGILAASRPVVGAISTGIARGAYERLFEWLAADDQGLRLLERQEVQIALAKMEEEIHLSRQIYFDAATEFDAVSLGSMQSSALMKMASATPRRLRDNPITKRRVTSDFAREATVKAIAHSIDDDNLARSLALSSMAKARGGDTAMQVTGTALEIAGLGCGSLRPELEKLMRDAKLCQIYEGTNQLNRLEVFESLVMKPQVHVIKDAMTAPSLNGAVH